MASPVNTAAPVISGVAQVGGTLTASTGAWTSSGSPLTYTYLTASTGGWTSNPTSFTYQWNRAGTAISGATSSTYVLVTADMGSTLTVSVTAMNASGSSSPVSSAATPVIIAAVTANTMAILNPSSPTVVSANQVTAPALQYSAISDANSMVPASTLAMHIAVGITTGSTAWNVEIWTHSAMAVRLTADGFGNFTGNLDLSAELAGPILVGVFAWNRVPGDNTYTVHLAAKMVLQIEGTPSSFGSLPTGATGMTLTWSDEFTCLCSTPCKPATGTWSSCTAPTATDGFTWYENKPGGGDYGDAAFEHTDSVYNPYTIINSFLRIRSTYDSSYVDPYGYSRHWYAGLLAGAFPDGTSNLPAMNNGYYEARIMVPTADASYNTSASGGTWPSFWMLQRPCITNTSIGNVEYDIMEMYGVDSTILHSNVWSYSPATGPNGATFDGSPTSPTGIDLSWDFHRYGLQITSTTVSTYFDDTLLGTVAKSALPGSVAINNFPMLTLAMGGGWPDNVPPAGYFDMWTDYVRYYS